MRRILLVLLLLLVTLPVLAQDANVQITSPQANANLSGIVDVTGTVNPTDLMNYFFEVAPSTSDPNTATWTPITLPSKTPVTNGTLVQLNTSIVADGSYTLRLRVFHTSGDVSVVTVGPLTFTNNGQIVQPATATPTGPVIIPRPVITNTLPIPVGGQMDNFDDNAAKLMQDAGMTWAKWQIPSRWAMLR
jgi:hypothetical protein